LPIWRRPEPTLSVAAWACSRATSRSFPRTIANGVCRVSCRVCWLLLDPHSLVLSLSLSSSTGRWPLPAWPKWIACIHSRSPVPRWAVRLIRASSGPHPNAAGSALTRMPNDGRTIRRARVSTVVRRSEGGVLRGRGDAASVHQPQDRRRIHTQHPARGPSSPASHPPHRFVFTPSHTQHTTHDTRHSLTGVSRQVPTWAVSRRC
jgi:hypothetical protein